MSCPQLVVCDFISHLPIYAPLNSLLSATIEKMDKYRLSKIIVTDDDFSIVGTLSKKHILKYLAKKRIRKNDNLYKKLRVRDTLEALGSFIAAYPGTDLREIRRIMLVTEEEYLPIAKNPWNKILLGFISLSQIQGMF